MTEEEKIQEAFAKYIEDTQFHNELKNNCQDDEDTREFRSAMKEALTVSPDVLKEPMTI